MARSKNTKKKAARAASKPAKRATQKSKPAKKTATSRRKTTTRKASTSAARSRRKTETEVEKRWRVYLEQRTELEAAVESVRAAEETLGTARDAERSTRRAFNEAKDALQELLEVEPAKSSSGSKKHRKLEPVPDAPVPIDFVPTKA